MFNRIRVKGLNGQLFISLLLISILILGFGMLNGCGGDADDGVTTVTMWIMPNSQEPVNDLKAVLRPFEKANPDIRVEVTSLDWGSAWQKITATATSGTGPDIIQLGSTWVGMVASLQAISDLSAEVESIGGADMFVDLAQQTMGRATIPGEIVSVPWIVDARALFYRTDVFKKLGLTKKDLATWASFEQTLAKIKKANLVINGVKIEPLGITGKNDWNVVHSLAPWIWGSGGNFIDDDYQKAVLSTSGAINGLDFYVGLARKGYIPLYVLEKNSYQIQSEFDNGFYAMYFNGPYALKSLTTPSELGGAGDSPVANNFDVVPYPRGPKGQVTYGGGSNLTIFSGATTKNRAAAWKVISYLTASPNAQVAYARMTGFMPALREAFEDPYFASDKRRSVFVESVKKAQNFPSISAWGPLEMTTLPRRFGVMWSDAMRDIETFSREDIMEHLRIADNEINAVLNKAE